MKKLLFIAAAAWLMLTAAYTVKIAWAQIPLSPFTTTLAAAVAVTDTQACVASASGIVLPSVAVAGSIFLIDQEAMAVTGQGSTSTCFRVKRGILANTASNSAAKHGNGQKVYVLGPTLSTGDLSRPIATNNFLSQKPYQSFEMVATPTLFGVATTSVTDVNGQFNFGAIEVDVNMIATGGCWLNGATVTTDKHIAYLWDQTGTLIANSALAGVADAGNASVYQCAAFVNAVGLQGPAMYFTGVQSNGTTDNVQMYNTGAVHATYPVGSQAGTFGTPAAIATIPTTFTAAKGPLMVLQQ